MFGALVGCHAILILGKSPIKWRQRPDMTIAVDWGVKLQSKLVRSSIRSYMYIRLIRECVKPKSYNSSLSTLKAAILVKDGDRLMVTSNALTLLLFPVYLLFLS